ncbi:Uncharacterised protein [Mycobacteroides abscessus subsp. abscessus]|nr:Uncharacterised protein [Mycobacteroides abscessus subsp. abscessus]
MPESTPETRMRYVSGWVKMPAPPLTSRRENESMASSVSPTWWRSASSRTSSTPTPEAVPSTMLRRWTASSSGSA